MALVFRQIALDKLSDPDDLDRLPRIVSPLGWLGLLGLAAVLAGVVAWGIVGRIPMTVEGRGMLVRVGGIHEVDSLYAGQLQTLSVRVGDVVYKGQVVAYLSQPRLHDEIADAEIKLQNLKEELAQSSSFSEANVELKARDLNLRESALHRKLKDWQDRKAYLQKKVADQSGLLAKGLTTRQKVADARRELADLESDMRNVRSDLQQIEVERQELTQHQEKDLTQIAQKIRAERLRKQHLEERALRESRVVSPHSGRVIEILVGQGRRVSQGQAIMNLEREGGAGRDLVGNLYVPPMDGKKVELGQKVLVSPTAVNPGEFGKIVGVVTGVAKYPSTEEGMMRDLNNKKLVAELMEKGAPFHVQVDLIPDISTTSQYRWTSGDGPPQRIFGGSMFVGSIFTEERPPISFVVPFFKDVLLGVKAHGDGA